MTIIDTPTRDLSALVRCYDASREIVASFGDRGADPPGSVFSLQRDTAKAIAGTPAGSVADLAAKVAVFWHEAGDRDDLADGMTDPSAVAVLRSILADIEHLAGHGDAGDAELMHRHDEAVAEGNAILATGEDLPGAISDPDGDGDVKSLVADLEALIAGIKRLPGRA